MKSLKEVCIDVKDSPFAYYVYVLHRPDGTPFYVGKGTRRSDHDQRISYHEHEARRGTPPPSRFYRNEYKINTIRKIWRDGGVIRYSVDSWHDLERDVYAREMELIATLGRKWKDDWGVLTNITEGGEKEGGISDETKEKISQSLKEYYKNNPDAVAKMAQRNREIFSSEEVRERCRNNAVKNESHKNIIKWIEENPDAVKDKVDVLLAKKTKWEKDRPEEVRSMIARRNETLRSDEHRRHMADATRDFIATNPEADKARRQLVQQTLDLKKEIKQECFRIVRQKLVDGGGLKNVDLSKDVTYSMVYKWKKRGLMTGVPDGGAPLAEWKSFLQQVKESK